MLLHRLFIKRAAWALLPSSLLLLLALPLPAEESWRWAEQQPLGSVLPDFTLRNHDGEPVALSSLAGKRGTLLIFSRSTDW